MSDAGGREAPHRSAYRPEIDGLRAIAVLAVICDHAGFGWIPGGFLGVDLFFVISGYLITGILLGDLREGRFSFRRFYERRARRILPALLLTMLVTVPIAVLTMIPADLEEYGQSVVATTLFANNVLLTGTSNYFATFSDFKPLIHTWSLGVEEQYYLLVPLLMLAAWRIGKTRAIAWGAAAGTVLSLLLCIWLAHRWGPANFYLLPPRAWELGAGSLAVLAEPRLRALAGRWGGSGLALLGLAMAVAPLFLFAQQMKLPNWPSVVPVAGAALLLLFAAKDEPVGRLLGLPPMRLIGLISYSAYLFHQPLFAFVAVTSLDQPSQALMAALIVPVLIAAYLSWRFVEQPFRNRERVSSRRLWITVTSGSALTLVLGLVLALTHGFAASRPDLADASAGYVKKANIAFNHAPLDYLGVPLPDSAERPRLLVVGDSFARDFVNMATETHRVDGWVISFANPKICRPGPLPPRLVHNAQRADVIVLGNRMIAETFPCLQRQVKQLHAITRARLIIVGTKSFGWSNNAPLMLPAPRRFAWRALPGPLAAAINARAKAALAGESYVDLMAKLIGPDGRVPLFTPDGKLISWDRQHVTRPGAAYVGAILFQDPAFDVLVPRK